ncbi:MAG: oxidoreductase, partial [Verrucomicrobiaceae bacterium]|nr:oxidoreductase [Verrucomicrobiaceae bacterium]
MKSFPFVTLVSGVFAASALSGCVSPSKVSSGDERRIRNKTFVITGASSGFGKGVALKLGASGANVVLADIRGALLTKIAADIRASGGRAITVTTDVAKAEDINRLAQAATRAFGHVDVWMNNVGVGAIGRFDDIPLRDHSRLIDINVKGVIYGSHVALRLFKAQGYGTIVNTGSIDSEVPLAYQGSYSASKAAVLSLGRVLNEELRLSGIKTISVATIMPWAVDTPWWTHAANYSGHKTRMAAMDDPGKIVDAMVRASIHPKEEVVVGWKAKASYMSHHIFPDATERLSANIAHREMLKGAPEATHSGSLHRPMP